MDIGEHSGHGGRSMEVLIFSASINSENLYMYYIESKEKFLYGL